jgi:sugar phosphate isomerase/epimerase
MSFGGLLVPAVFDSCRTAAVAVLPVLKGTPAEKAAGNLGIVLGVQTYSFRDRPLDEAIKAMQQLGIKSCELWDGHVEPRVYFPPLGQPQPTAKEKADNLRKWRDTVDMSSITAIRKKLDAAGITPVAYTTSTIKDNSTDHDIELIFRIAQALEVPAVYSSSTVNVMKRVYGFAKHYNIKVALHNHSHTENPNEISSPYSFARASAGMSDMVYMNMDIGHFTAANFDAVSFLKEHHDRILSIHLKDRKKNQGPNMPFGEGDTPIIEVLRLIRDQKWPITADIEYEYKGGDSLDEVKKCLDYCKKALA